MSVMTRFQNPRQLQDGINAIFGMEYDRLPARWKEVFEVFTSQKAYEEDLMVVGLGGASTKTEGGVIRYDQGGESYVSRYSHITTALAFAITEEMLEDGLYGSIADRYGASMARSMRYTEEGHAHAIFNNAFNSSYAGGDGTELCGTHTLYNGGTLANEPSTAADLSEDALEDACIAIGKFVDDRGIPIMCRPKKLFVPIDLDFTAQKILQTQNQVGTANNDVNAVRGRFSGGHAISEYLSDTDAWFIVTDAPHGLKKFDRRKLKKAMEGDFETGNMRYKATQRYSFGWTDFRGVYGCPGA